jgi:RNA 3'-terminal phosphate cyclase
MTGSEVLILLEGSNFFRQYLVYSILSGRKISIRQIRPYDDSPGIKGSSNILSQLKVVKFRF